MLSKVKHILRRKFELHSLNVNEESITMRFAIYNFVDFKSKHFYIKLNGSNVPHSYSKISQNLIEVRINTQYIVKDNNTFVFYYKNKKLWLVTAQGLESIFEIGDNIYISKVNKSLILSRYKTNYNLLGTYKDVIVQQTDNGHICFDTEFPLDALLLLNRDRQIEIPMTANEIDLSEVQQSVEKQDYKVYLVSGNAIYSPYFTQKKEIYYLMMQQDWVNDRLVVSTHNLEVPYLRASSILNETSLSINTKIEGNSLGNNIQFITLALVDNDLANVYYLPTTINEENINSKLLVDNFENLREKFLVAIFYNNLAKSESFYLVQSQTKVNFSGYYSFDEQIYQLNVKDKQGVSIVSKQPKFRLGVNFVDENMLNIYFQPNIVYERFQYYITFEERTSQNKYHISIERGEQDIKVPYEELERLRTLPKNIIDIFISIYDGQNLVRKEKIKYRTGEYKKDNYLTLKERKHDGKRTFYMFTLTPFKNVKMETFQITEEQYQILKVNKKDNKVWLIGERTDTAQDNGIQFFKWLQEYTEIEAYYVINDQSKDYERIKHLKNVISFGSKQHYEVAAKAKVLISTHDLENILPYKTARGFWGYENCIRVFLQHGVLGRKNVEYHKQYYDLPFHLFNVSSKSEKYDIVVNQLGYKANDVAITGLPRFDNLPLVPRKKIKKILIMPTWRDWLNSDYAFNNSEYMQQYLDLINDKKLEALLEQYDVEINFYPHYRAQEFFKDYLEDTSRKIQYIELGEKTVQELLIEHDLLITDYSSVSFDFSYMKKPVIFFHFDVDRFFRKGILRPVEETFIGEITYNKNELINNIERAIKSDNIRQDVDISTLFDHVDHKNSERVYKSILNKINEIQN